MLLNGARVTVRAVLHAGDVLELAVEGQGNSHILPRKLPIEVLLETADLLVVNKPAGMPTHPSHGHFEDTLANGLAYHYTANGVSFRPRFINRLDRNTTGAVLVARHALSGSKLCADMAGGKIQKTYLALVDGQITQKRVIESGIRRRAESIIFREACPMDEGDYAKTIVEPIASNAQFSLVRLIPCTGRTHQLRVHLAFVGHPLLGDDLYGGSDVRIARHALHAAVLTFPAPQTREKVTVRAPLPADMRDLILELGREATECAKAECGFQAQAGEKL